jgi:hypothetical protein
LRLVFSGEWLEIRLGVALRPFTSLASAADEQEIEAGEDMVDIVDIRER